MKTSCGFVAGQAEQQILKSFHGQLAAGNVEVLQTEGAGEELLERGRYLFALFGAKRVVRYVEVGQVRGTAAQESSKQLQEYKENKL